MRFMTRGLLSKWGFKDGDILKELLHRHGYDLGELNDHDVLCAVVRDHVIPEIRNHIEVSLISTMHNPIRITKVDGALIDNFQPSHPGVVLDPECLEVPDEVILRYADRAVIEWTRKRDAGGGWIR